MNLYIIATPIGNLKDITFRAIETLQKVDLILCEDTRQTKKLLDYYKIKKPLLAYHQRSQLTRIEKIIEHLQAGKNLALVTDAGTPGISDPGNELIAKLISFFDESQLQIIPVPGPSALTTLASVSGIDLSKFIFYGFPPNKKGRETFFRRVLEEDKAVIYYDSPYRFLKNLRLLQELSNGARISLIVGRELTKVFEEIRRGDLNNIFDYYQKNQDKVKGEFVIILHNAKQS
ncbi:MAG TPA: 16S rRNA (cytidine(1402)-2'-O)-methyltransferase [Candidatus Moranbacteria bacterium]|nr:16S rRNA (cytidine(1402)-2'-O)-methyltransferase [Candidatus Moranbacteria bacterium]